MCRAKQAAEKGFGAVILRSRRRRRILHGVENTQSEILRGVHPEPSEIFRCAQNDSEGLRMTVWQGFSAASKARRYTKQSGVIRMNATTADSTDSPIAGCRFYGVKHLVPPRE